jgi:putative hydrolase of the HAD superfamily
VTLPSEKPVPATDRKIDAVIFDFGGVLASNGRPSDVIKRFPNDPPDKVLKVMMGDYGQDTDHPWHRLERGEITMSQYRTDLGVLVLEAGLQPIQLPPDTGKSTFIGITFEPCEPIITLVHELKTAGFRLGVLTNNVRELRSVWWPMMDFNNIFDDVVDSHEVGTVSYTHLTLPTID